RAAVEGPIVALDDRPRPGREPTNRSQGMVGIAGVPEGEGSGLSARIVDNAASGRSRSRAWTGARAPVSRPFGAGHCVQDPRRGGGEAAYSAVLLHGPRLRAREKDGRRSR